MLITTLIPTFTHIGAGMGALITRVAGASDATLLELESPEGPSEETRRLVIIGLMLRIGAALAAAGAIVWAILWLWGLSTQSGGFGGALYGFAECVAEKPEAACVKVLRPRLDDFGANLHGVMTL